nr:MAG TPA: hypothetical protein [Caudoviricetes sp.]
MQRGENSTSLRRPARKNKMPLAMLARTLLNKKDGWGEAIGHDRALEAPHQIGGTTRMKKKNCRMTDLERAQHARAVQFRKMTDAQICEYLDSLLEREREARSAAPAPSKEEIVNEFLDTLSIRTTSGLRVSDATIRKIRSIAVDRGFIKSAEVSDG